MKHNQLPHDETLLATLLNVHVVGGTTDLAAHLEGATMRPAIVEEHIAVLRKSGYPGYEEDGPNSAKKVRDRMQGKYENRYNQAKFIPHEIEKSIRAAFEEQKGQPSLDQRGQCYRLSRWVPYHIFYRTY